MKTYTIGKITLTQQALAVFIIQTVIALVMLSVFRKTPKVAAGAFLAVFVFGSYATYLTNCTVVGNCKELAWFLVFVNALSVLILPMRLKMLRNTSK
jgi:intracellular septation protein A